MNRFFNAIRNEFSVILLFLSSVALILFALGMYWKMFGEFPVSNLVEKWGQFGDYVGGVLNPGLSFISIILVCLTLYATSKQSAIQSFESILFELIRFHKENLMEIKVSYDDGKERLQGRDALKSYITEVKLILFGIVEDELPVEDRIKIAIDKVYLEDEAFSNIGHYFRNIYHIFKHIDESSFLSKKEKQKYAKLVRAQLSSIESGALFLNGLSSRGAASKILIERYSLLQEFRLTEQFKERLKNTGALQLYADEAYEDKNND
ncbi:Putative phage abortive infection protein [Kosakonia oryzendophytica]|uniref:Putative phage abortive infection protein n=1 Tax=Kosakonia oryzendophytica TaxID=1005665 RepID=A0A1C4DN20_9ENTR|nr:putative phage abortive infection protein [Kosakonia oryzendophytica]SCC32737.1 Putative phage abortive infection protein [Kosakonia oryzendophytica]